MPAYRVRPRHGFTLVELLVVIAIIGILVALLLPAVQAARESARRTACSNNLKQVSLALLATHDVLGAFPKGAYTSPGPGASANENEEDGLGWATKILPAIEEQAAYDRLVNNGVPGYDGDPWKPYIFANAYLAGVTSLPGANTVINAFLCPSVTLPDRMPMSGYFGQGGGTPVRFNYGASHYKGSRGYCDNGMFLRTEEALSSNVCSTADYDGDGVLDDVEKKPVRSIKISNVTDGTSKTIAIGESAYFVNLESFPTWVGAFYEDGAVLFKTRDAVNCNLNAHDFPLSDDILATLPGGEGSDDCSYSWHPGGAYFSFVDGSVHFLTEDLDLRIFRLLGDRRDGQIMGDF